MQTNDISPVTPSSVYPSNEVLGCFGKVSRRSCLWTAIRQKNPCEKLKSNRLFPKTMPRITEEHRQTVSVGVQTHSDRCSLSLIFGKQQIPMKLFTLKAQDHARYHCFWREFFANVLLHCIGMKGSRGDDGKLETSTNHTETLNRLQQKGRHTYFILGVLFL